MRLGTPMYTPAQKCWMVIGITHPDGRHEAKVWESRRGARAIKSAVRRHYPNCRLSFGAACWVTL